MKLSLAPDFALPPDAITQTFGILAVRGAGKSNLAAVMGEQMSRARLPFVVVDPVGSWWGLRSSADGQGPGLEVPIFGGRHGDVPLEKGGGQLVADLVVDERLSCVLDVSELSEGDKIRFLIDFAERLYRKNQDPLHLFLEEADDYAPQRPFREQARLLRAWENIVRRGRARGLGITMITQRSAALNKNVLTQIETLFVLRTTSPQDRKAILSWVEYHGQGKELVESLPSLEAGEAWVWSPSWLRVMQRIRVTRRTTFDSGATPKDVRGSRPPATLADVDLKALTVKMTATIERAKQEDPRELRRQLTERDRRIRELERGGTKVVPAEKVVEQRVEIPILKDAQIARLEKFGEKLAHAGDQMLSVVTDLAAFGKELAAAIRTAKNGHRYAPARSRNMPAPAPRPVPIRALHTSARTRTIVPPAGAEQLARAQRKILNALAFLESVGITTPDRTQASLFAGLSPTAGYTNNMYGGLRTAGFIDYPKQGYVMMTDAGRALADPGTIPQTAEEMHQFLLSKLPAAQRKILLVLIEAYPQSLAKREASERAGLSPEAGYTNNMYGRLRSMGLIDYPTPGEVVALPVLFLEEARR